MGCVRVTNKKSKLEEKTVDMTANGMYMFEPSEGYDGISKFTANVEVDFPTQEKTIEITQNNTSQSIRPDIAQGYQGLSKVNIDVNIPIGVKDITANGTYFSNADSLEGYNQVNVNVPAPKLGQKLITQNGSYSPVDDGLDGYSLVNVNVEGSGGGGTSAEVKPYVVYVVDYDGEELEIHYGNTGDEITLPFTPIHDGLEFTGWVSAVPITDNKVIIDKQDIVIMPTYKTTSGKTEIDFDVKLVDMLNVRIRPIATIDNQIFTVDWGDGSEPETVTTSSSYILNHTYETSGVYTATLVSNANYYFDSTSSFGNSTTDATNLAYAIKNVRLSEQVARISSGAFRYAKRLETISVPKTTYFNGTYIFGDCWSLKALVVPVVGSTALTFLCGNCYTLTYCAVADTLNLIAGQMFTLCYSLKKFTIPTDVTSIGATAFNYCVNLESLCVPDGCVVNASAFAYTQSLKEMNFPSSVTNIPASLLTNARSIRKIVFKGNITSIATTAFGTCNSLKEVDLSNCSAVPTLANANAFTTGANYARKILVPASLYDSWIVATNWSNTAIKRQLVAVEGK